MYKVKEVQLIEGPLIIHNVLALSTLTRPSQAHSMVLLKRFPSSATATKAVRPNYEVSHRYCYMYIWAHAQPIQKGGR